MRIFLSGVVVAALLAVADAGAADADAAFYRTARVANYAIPGPRYATPDYEHLSLWANDAGATRVSYRYGADAKELRLRLLGAHPDGTGFAVAFPNGLVLDVVPQDGALRVRDRQGDYDKTFEWEYEGPVDGRGTFCAPCVEEADAAAFVRRHFLGK